MSILIHRTKRGKGSDVNWADIMEDWVQSRMGESKGLTSKELADKWHVAEPTIRNRSSTEKWKEKLEQRIRFRDEDIANKLKEAGKTAIAKVQEDLVGNEVEIRRRHATTSRHLQAKAMKKILSVDVANLSVRDAIAMLKLGIDEERRAMGFEQVFNPEMGDRGHPDYMPLRVQNDQHKKIQQMGLVLLNALQQKVDKLTSTDAQIKRDVGLGDGIEENTEGDFEGIEEAIDEVGGDSSE